MHLNLELLAICDMSLGEASCVCVLCSGPALSKQPTFGQKLQLLCRCHKVTVHHDDCVMNNAWDLFSATDHDVIGAGHFSVCAVPLTAFFLVPPILPFLIPCFQLAFVARQGPLSLWRAVPSGEGWARRSCWLRRWAAVLAGGLVASPARLAAVKAHLLLPLPHSLPVVGGGLSRAFQADIPRIPWPAWEPSTPRPPSSCPISKGGFLAVPQ